MVTNEKGRIAIFEYDWSLYSFIKDLAMDLADAGYNVDFFQKDPVTFQNFADTASLQGNPRLRFFSFSRQDSLFYKVQLKLLTFFRLINKDYFQNPRNLIDPTIFRRSQRIIANNHYKCLIGVEKKGLIWAGLIARIFHWPLIYYSLELYLDDHPGIQDYIHLREAEKLFHRESVATIIQDHFRARELLKYNGVDNSTILYFPISAKGGVQKNRSSYLQEKYKINEAETLLLYFGLIQPERYSDDLCKIACSLPNNTRLILHGYGDSPYLNRLQAQSEKERISFSLDFLPEQEILKVIASATIGLALYPSNSANDRLAAFSSVKVAYYLQCGIPLIAFRSESFTELMNTYRCGELIDSIEEIPAKVSVILKNHEQYRQQSFQAYEHFYNFDNNFYRFLIQFEKHLMR